MPPHTSSILAEISVLLGVCLMSGLGSCASQGGVNTTAGAAFSEIPETYPQPVGLPDPDKEIELSHPSVKADPGGAVPESMRALEKVGRLAVSTLLQPTEEGAYQPAKTSATTQQTRQIEIHSSALLEVLARTSARATPHPWPEFTLVLAERPHDQRMALRGFQLGFLRGRIWFSYEMADNHEVFGTLQWRKKW